jgi:type VI secretion system protein ImpE
LIPTRYAGSDLADAQQAMARRTDWIERSPGFFVGCGQRLLTTDIGDLALMDVRSIEIEPAQ